MVSHQSRYHNLAVHLESSLKIAKKLKTVPIGSEATMKEILTDIEKELAVYREISIKYKDYMKTKSHRGLRRTVMKVLKDILHQQIADIEISNTLLDPNEKKILPIEEQYSGEESMSFSNSKKASARVLGYQYQGENFLGGLSVEKVIVQPGEEELSREEGEDLRPVSVLEYNNLVRPPGRVNRPH